MDYLQPNFDEIDRNFVNFYDNRDYSMITAIYPEKGCSRIHNYFTATGLPSYIEPVPDFELPYKSVVDMGLDRITRRTRSYNYDEIKEFLW